jgi:hypothetical protein
MVIFLLILKVHVFYDTVHIFKNIRNNWINLKDSEKTLILYIEQNFRL